MPVPDLEERVAALEAALTFACTSPPPRPLTEAEMAGLRQQLAEVTREPSARRVIPPPPPLTPDEIRRLLRECVTVVKPGETLILRVPWTVTPNQVRELQDFVNQTAEWLDLPFKTLILPGDALALAEPEPDFMQDVRADTFRNTKTEAVRLTRLTRLTHLPTGVTIEAPTREEAVAKLGRALQRYAERHPEEATGAA